MNGWIERIERLEQASRAAERRARRWQLATGLLVGLGLIVLPLHSGTAQGQGVGNLAAQVTALQARVAALEKLLARFSVEQGGNDIVITGANLHLRNGLGATATKNSLGNLIVGYNESLPHLARTGSHNLVVGSEHDWTSFGGLVAGQSNRITAPYASVSGGQFNTAGGLYASVSGGETNRAVGDYASVSGGGGNRALGTYASVSGGVLNDADANQSSVSGGRQIDVSATDGWAAGSQGAALFSGAFRSP